MAEGKYYSNYSGKQIDQAYQAIKQLTTSDNNKIPVITQDGNIAVLKASDFTLTNIATKPTYDSSTAGQFVSANESGELQASGFSGSSFFEKRTITPGHLIAMGTDGQLVDAGEAGPSEQIAAMKANISAFETRVNGNISTLQSSFNVLQSSFNALDAEVQTYSGAISDLEDAVEEIAQYEVTYTQIDEPENDEDIYYLEDGTKHIVYEQYDPDDPSACIPVNGYKGSRDNSDYFVKLNTLSQNEKLTLADYIPRPYSYYTPAGKQALKNLIGKITVWGQNGTLTNTTVTHTDLEALVGANLITRTTSLETGLTQVRTDLESEITTVQTTMVNDYVKKTITSEAITTEAVRYRVVEGGESFALSKYYDIDAEQDVDSAILANVDGSDVPVYYGGLRVQLYAADGVTMIYPVTL